MQIDQRHVPLIDVREALQIADDVPDALRRLRAVREDLLHLGAADGRRVRGRRSREILGDRAAGPRRDSASVASRKATADSAWPATVPRLPRRTAVGLLFDPVGDARGERAHRREPLVVEHLALEADFLGHVARDDEGDEAAIVGTTDIERSV